MKGSATLTTIAYKVLADVLGQNHARHPPRRDGPDGRHLAATLRRHRPARRRAVPRAALAQAAPTPTTLCALPGHSPAIENTVRVNAMRCRAPRVSVAVNRQTWEVAASESRCFLLQ